MNAIFGLPARAEVSSLRDIAQHVSVMSIVNSNRIPTGRFEVSRSGSQVLWNTAEACAAFNVCDLQKLELLPLESCGVDFVALVLTFVRTDTEALRYRFVTCPQSEVDWLRQTAAEIGGMLELEVHDQVLPQPVSHGS